MINPSSTRFAGRFFHRHLKRLEDFNAKTPKRGGAEKKLTGIPGSAGIKSLLKIIPADPGIPVNCFKSLCDLALKEFQ
jgi:hypothetical protein